MDHLCSIAVTLLLGLFGSGTTFPQTNIHKSFTTRLAILTLEYTFSQKLTGKFLIQKEPCHVLFSAAIKYLFIYCKKMRLKSLFQNSATWRDAEKV